MLFEPPNYPQIVLCFDYRGWKLELDQSDLNGQLAYSVWASYRGETAVAVPCAFSKAEAVKRAKSWVDARYC